MERSARRWRTASPRGDEVAAGSPGKDRPQAHRVHKGVTRPVEEEGTGLLMMIISEILSKNNSK